MNEFISSEDISVKEILSNKTKKQTEKSPEQLSEENVHEIVNRHWTIEQRKAGLVGLYSKEKENREKFEKSGIYDLFTKLRDSGEIKWSNETTYSYETLKLSCLDKFKGKSDQIKTEILDFHPAMIQWSYYNQSVSICFDGGGIGANGFSSHIEDDVDAFDTCKLIEAKFDGNTLLINDKPVNGDLLESVRNEIKEANFVKYDYFGVQVMDPIRK